MLKTLTALQNRDIQWDMGPSGEVEDDQLTPFVKCYSEVLDSRAFIYILTLFISSLAYVKSFHILKKVLGL